MSLSSLVVTLDVVRDLRAATRSAVGRSSSFAGAGVDAAVGCTAAVEADPLFCRLMRSISSDFIMKMAVLKDLRVQRQFKNNILDFSHLRTFGVLLLAVFEFD